MNNSHIDQIRNKSFAPYRRWTFVALATTTLLAIVRFVINAIEVDRLQSNSIEKGIYPNYGGVGAHNLRITVALIVATILWIIPRELSKKLIFIPLCWILIEYALRLATWYQHYLNDQITSFDITQFFRGSWFDILVTVVVALTLLYVFSWKKSSVQEM